MNLVKENFLGIWDVMCNEEIMHALCQEGKTKCDQALSKNSSVLIGNLNEAKCKKKKPDMAASIGNEQNCELKIPTIFDDHEQYNKTELQWALLTLLALDKTLRELIAENTPPVAADYVRKLDVTYERWLLGTPNSAARTAYECAMMFANNIEICYGLSV